MGNSEDIRGMARQRAENYKKALQYLKNLKELSYHDFAKVIQIAGIEMTESEISRTWEMSKMTIPSTEGLRQIYRETLEKGIEVFEKVDRELPSTKKSEEAKNSIQNTTRKSQKWWEFWK